MSKVTKYCDNCDVEFSVKHEASEEHFKVMFCPFCAAQVDADEQYEFEDEEEE